MGRGIRRSTSGTWRCTRRTSGLIRELTLNPAVRYSDAKALDSPAGAPGGFLGARTGAGGDRRQSPLANLSPRVGGAYDPFGTGRPALKAAIGHYPDRVIVARRTPRAIWRGRRSSHGPTGRGTFDPDCNLHNPAGESTGADMLRSMAEPDLRQAAPERPIPMRRQGFNKQSHHWQASMSMQHELRPGIALNVGDLRTWYGGFLATDNPTVDPTSYDPAMHHRARGRRPARWRQRSAVGGVLRPQTPILRHHRRRGEQASDFGNRTQIYNGVDITTNAGLDGGGALSGGVSMGQTVTDNCMRWTHHPIPASAR